MHHRVVLAMRVSKPSESNDINRLLFFSYFYRWLCADANWMAETMPPVKSPMTITQKIMSILLRFSRRIQTRCLTWQMVATLFLALLIRASGQSFTLSFNPSPSEATTQGGQYGAFWTTTNSVGNNYIGFCKQGSTNISFTAGGTNANTITQNPVCIYATFSVGTNQSPRSVYYLFDTNNFTGTPTNPVPVGLLPPTNINVKRQ